MTQTNRYALTFETLAELSSEIRSAHADPAQALPKLGEVLAEISPLSRGILFLGMANDGLPVLLNMLDPRPGPILIAGDKGSGKTKLLQIIAQSIGHMPTRHNIRYIVFTNHADEWNSIKDQNREGILPINASESASYLARLVEWAHNERDSQQIITLLIDDFEAILSSNEIRQYLRWLLLRGPAHQVWPFVTLNSVRAENPSSWLDEFRTRLFGRIEDPKIGEGIAGRNENLLNELISGSQFAMREGESWLTFWIPRSD